MTNNAGRDLGYGRLGPVIYNREEKIWQYGRDPGYIRALRLYQNPSELLRSPSPSQPSSDRSEAEAAKDVQEDSPTKYTKQFGRLTKRHPELQLAQPFFASFAKESEAIRSATEKYDPLTGDLLAYGLISAGDGSDISSAEVLAVPGGSNGDRLQLYQTDQRSEDDWNLENAKRPRVALPTSVIGHWVGPGVPIRQIVFSRPHSFPPSGEIENFAHLVAIRLWKETVILRPVLRREASHFPIPQDATNPSTTQIRVQLLVIVTEEMTGGLEHLDVAFNPWRADQIAIVNPRGNFVVFGVSENTSSNANLRPENSMVDLRLYDAPRAADNENEPDNSLFRDWSRLIWIASPITIMICTRTAITFVDSRRMSRLDPEPKIPKLGLKASSNWILDIRRHPLHLDQVFVLTSTHIFWLYICLDEDLVNIQGFDFGANILASIRHFRGHSDLSLKLAVSITERGHSGSTGALRNERCITLLLSSRLNYLVTSYQIKDSWDPLTSRMTVCDPVSVVFESASSSLGSNDVRIVNLALRPVASVERGAMGLQDELAASLRGSSLELYDFKMLTSDLRLQRRLLWRADRLSSLRSPGSPEILETSIQPPFHSPRILSKQDNGSSRTGGQSEESEGTIATADRDPTYAALDLRPIYRLLQSTIKQTDDDSLAVDAVATMRTLYQNLQRRPESCGEPMESLIEQISAYEIVNDIDSASGAFHDLLHLIAPPDAPDEMPLMVQRISNASNASTRSSDAILSSIYRSLVRSLLTPLPPKIPGRVRLVLESLARKMSTDVCLASARTELERLDLVDEIGDTQELESLSQNPPGSLFSLQGHPTSSQQSMLSGWDGSSSIPPVSMSGLPSPRTTPSPRLSTISSSTIQASYSNLKRYVAFNKPLPIAHAQTARPLAHWTTGVDPARYSWTATQHAIENLEEAAVEDSGLTAKERNRLRKRAERHIKKQRAEARKQAERELQLSSQPVVLATSSRGEPLPSLPVPPPGPRPFNLPFWSSQTVASQSQSSQMPVVVASQNEPGRHGGRGMGPPPRKKKRAGF